MPKTLPISILNGFFDESFLEQFEGFTIEPVTIDANLDSRSPYVRATIGCRLVPNTEEVAAFEQNQLSKSNADYVARFNYMTTGRKAVTIDKKWQHNGLTCVLRHGAFDAPCGYVAIPKDSPLYGQSPAGVENLCRDELPPVEITFNGSIDDENEYFLGFDMAHAWDLEGFGPDMHCIRTDEECIEQTNEFADFIIAFNEKHKATPTS